MAAETLRDARGSKNNNIHHTTQENCCTQQSGLTLTYGKLFFGERDGNLFEIFGRYLRDMLKNKFVIKFYFYISKYLGIRPEIWNFLFSFYPQGVIKLTPLEEVASLSFFVFDSLRLRVPYH